MLSIWFASLTMELTGTIGYLSPMGTLPEGLIVLPLRDRQHDFVGSHAVRLQPPWIDGHDQRPRCSRRTAAAPRRRAGRRTSAALGNRARSLISATLRVSLHSTR